MRRCFAGDLMEKKRNLHFRGEEFTEETTEREGCELRSAKTEIRFQYIDVVPLGQASAANLNLGIRSKKMDPANLGDVQVALEAACSILFKEILKDKAENEVFRLHLNADGLERVTSTVIEQYFDAIYAFGDSLRCRIPTPSVIDRNKNFKISKFGLAGSRHAWYDYEMGKWHRILSLVNRYNARPGMPRSAKLRLLKHLWHKHRPQLAEAKNGTDNII